VAPDAPVAPVAPDSPGAPLLQPTAAMPTTKAILTNPAKAPVCFFIITIFLFREFWMLVGRC
jgi:hypothetical protein